MSDYTFNIAKGRPAALHDAVNNNSPANSALVIIPLSIQGSKYEARDYDTVADVLAGASNEQTSGNWSRKLLTDSDIAASFVNDTSNRCELALPAVVWSSPAPTVGNNVVALLIAYDPDTTTGSDSDLIPISSHTFDGTADGNPITLNASDYMHSGPGTDEPPPDEDPAPDGMAGDWQLVMNDEFDLGLDTSMWRPGWFVTPVSNPVNSGEDAGMRSSHVTVPGDGYLHLLLTDDDVLCPDTVTRPYSGALVNTNPHDGRGSGGFEFLYGAIEVRAYIPAYSGITIANWPVLWTVGQEWPEHGEVDFAEGLGGDLEWRYHSLTSNPGHNPPGDWTGWHTFGYRWEAGEILIYRDGAQIGPAITVDVASEPHYIVLTNSIGIGSAVASTPADLLVDYVRVWQPA